MLEGQVEMKKHIMIPDLQVTPDTPTDHLSWIGEYIVEQKPDVVVQIGDLADMESLSSYDKGKRSFEGRRYIRDIDSAHKAMKQLNQPLTDYNLRQTMNKKKLYRPDKRITLGNHEYRIQRAIEDDARLDGTLGLQDLDFAHYGWKSHDFLEPVEIDGVHYAHFFANPMSGRPFGGQSIDTRLKTIGFSFSMGHQQVCMTGQRYLNNGSRIRGLVCGACYLHDEDYMGHQGNSYWRGLFVKHEVRNGEYDLMEVSLDYLCRKYEGIPLWEFMQRKHPDLFDRSIWMKRQEYQHKLARGAA